MLRAIAGTILVALTAAFAAPADPVEGAPTVHLRLTASIPGTDTTVSANLKQICLWFSQEPQVALSRVSVTGPSGAVKLAKVVADAEDPKLLLAKVEQVLPAGNYKLAWRTASADGHVIRGEIPFKVGSTE